MGVADRKKAVEAVAARDEEVLPEPETISGPAGDVPSSTLSADRKAHSQSTNRTKRALDAEERVSVRCAKDEIVQINGHTYQIQGGVRVEVPLSVAEILFEAKRA